MQQIALPSLYSPDRRPVPTQPIPLVRRAHQKPAKRRARKFVAGMLFGVLMSLTLVLLGYEARVLADQNPTFVRDAIARMTSLVR
jgi:hypothetical protein